MAKRRFRRRASPSLPSAAPFPPSIHLTSVYQALKDRERDRQVERALQNEELRERIRELRRYVKGFEGPRYHLRYVDDWSEANRAHVIDSSKRLRNLISSPHMTVPVPRSRAKRKALQRFTNQDVRDMKRFVIHTEAPERTTLEFSKRGRVRLRYRTGPKHSYAREFFLWRDFNKGKHPVTLQAQRKVLARMLPVMPEGRYAFWTYTHGMTGKPHHKRFLSQVLTEWYHAYEDSQYAFRHEGFGKVLSGLVYLGTWRNMRQAEKKREKERRKYQTGMRITKRIRRQKTRDIKSEIDHKLFEQIFGRKKDQRRKFRRKHK